MKKLVKLISVVMLIAMCFSLVSANAFADSGVVVIGGPESSASASTGRTSFSYGGTAASVDDANGSVASAGSSSKTTTASSDGTTVKSAPSGVQLDADIEKIDFSAYLSDSNIANNIDYIKYVLTCYKNGLAVTSSELVSAKTVFGDVIDYGVVEVAKLAAANETSSTGTAVNNSETDGETELSSESISSTGEALNAGNEDENDNSSSEDESTEEKVQEEQAGSTGTVLYESGIPSAPFEALVKGKTYTNVVSAIKAAGTNGTMYIVYGATGSASLKTDYGDEIVIDFKGVVVDNTGKPGEAAFAVTSGLYNFQNGVINGDGFRVEGGSVILESMKVNVGEGNSALTVTGDAYVDADESNTFVGSTANSQPTVDILGGRVDLGAAVKATYYTDGDYGCAVGVGIAENATEGAILNVTGTPADTDGIYGPTGIKVNKASYVTIYSGTVTGMAKISDPDSTIEGAGIAVMDEASYVSIEPYHDSYIHSYYNGATRLDGLGATSDDHAENIVVSDLSTHITLEPEAMSNYAEITAVCSLDGVYYNSLADALDKVEDASNKTITILRDYVETDAVEIAKDVVINGDGHTIIAQQGIEISSGNVVINNVTVDGDAQADSSITVSSGKATLQNVIVDHAAAGLTVTGGVVTVDGLAANYNVSTAVGIVASGGTTNVYDCVIRCVKAVADDPVGLTIYQGAFKLFDSNTDNEDGIANAKSCAAGGGSKTEDGYYYIEANEVNLEIVYGGDSTGSYLTYTKKDPTKNSTDNAIQFRVTDGDGDAAHVTEINAIGTDGQVYNLTFQQSSNEYYVTLKDNDLKNLPAGKYDVAVKYKDSGIIHVDLYVSPATSLVFEDHNGKVNNSTDKIPVYNAQSGKNGMLTIEAVENVDDTPLHVGVGADRYSVTWLSDACFSYNEDGDSAFLLLHDDLDYLGNGTNYVWLDYGDFWVPVEFIVENAAASISPTSSSWSKNDGQLKYTIWPDVLSVKVNDITLAKDKDYSIDTDGNLIINEKFLLTLDNGDYNMVVSTSKGGVGVNLHIGESLKNDGQDYHVYAGTKGLSFVASSAIDFTKGIWIGKANPVLVDPSYYSVTANNKFTLSSDYLNKLTTLGTYYISAYVGDDAEYCTTTFRIISASEAAYTPTTGDNSNLVIWIVLLVLAAVIIVVLLIPYLRKKKAANVEAEAQEEAPAETPVVAEAPADEEKKE